MPSVTTEGIILKRKNFGEADRVLTVLGKHHGKISIIARGVRKITSRRAGNIEVLNRVKLHLFKSRNFYLQEAEAIETYPTIKSNLTLSAYGFHIIELVEKIIAENQFNASVYSLVVSALQLLEVHPRQLFIRAFEVKLLSVSGFWSINAIPRQQPDLAEILKDLEYSSWEKIASMQVSKTQATSLENILKQFLEKVLESNLKSVQVLKKLKLAS